ncbi:MAG: hypothetical protein ACYDAQ_13540 [Mycobacteriales bacterium]
MRRYALLPAWLVVIAVFTVLRPHTFPTLTDFRTITGSQTVLLVIVLGLVVPLTAGEFDILSRALVTGLRHLLPECS